MQFICLKDRIWKIRSKMVILFEALKDTCQIDKIERDQNLQNWIDYFHYHLQHIKG